MNNEKTPLEDHMDESKHRSAPIDEVKALAEKATQLESPTPLSAEQIFNFHWKMSTGKEADETTRRHMTWVFNAMNEHASQQTAQLRQQVEESERKRENQFKTIGDFQDVCNKHFPGGNVIIYGSDLDKRLSALKERNEKMERAINGALASVEIFDLGGTITLDDINALKQSLNKE